ncbi:MAG: DUF1015 family protein [Acidimicrobiia bacterium]|nr:DUF1015 family protein [Acidimicrobiia bacterium]NNL69210.1 DUF1015 domain-containing protein [Acidimicrobiia bacterium]
MIRALHGFVVDPAMADRVVAPVAEKLSGDDRTRILSENPDNSLRLLAETPADRADARAYLDRVIQDGTYHPTEGWWAYRITDGDHRQTGVIAEVAVEAYESNRIRRHENTVAEVATHVADTLEQVRGSSHPVSLLYRRLPDVEEIIGPATVQAPAIRVERGSRIQEAWPLPDAAALQEALESIPTLYIADGHHRTSGAAALASRRGASAPDHAAYFLAALFPADQMRTLSYHRCLHLPDHSPGEILAVIARHFTLEPIPLPPGPHGVPDPGHVWVHGDGSWYDLELAHGPDAGPTAGLDPSRLQYQILGPICDVADPRTDPRLNYIPGTVPFAELAGRCSEQSGITFVTRPPTVDDVIAVSDAGGVMPPKSTWFTPKLGAGIFLRVL